MRYTSKHTIFLFERVREKARERMWVSAYEHLSLNMVENEGDRLQQQQQCARKSQGRTVKIQEKPVDHGAPKVLKTRGHTSQSQLCVQPSRGKREGQMGVLTAKGGSARGARSHSNTSWGRDPRPQRHKNRLTPGGAPITWQGGQSHHKPQGSKIRFLNDDLVY